MSSPLPTSDGAPAHGFEPRSLDSVTVFVVDDDPGVRSVMARSIQNAGYAVHQFPSGNDALDALRETRAGVVVTDRAMPGMTGLELVERALEVDPDIRFIVVTGTGSEAAAQASLRLGVTDYLTKPHDPAELVSAVHRAAMQYSIAALTRNRDMWLRREVHRQTERIRDVTTGVLATLLNALEARHAHFRGHSQAVSDFAASLARAAGLADEDVEEIRVAGLLHDIGMIGVPDSIVGKPRELSVQERRIIETHCEKGAEILAPLAHLSRPAQYVLDHHERLDGSGYPARKRGSDISLGGLVVGLAETWSGLTEDRPYRDRVSSAEAIATLAAAKDVWYPANLLGALSKIV